MDATVAGVKDGWPKGVWALGDSAGVDAHGGAEEAAELATLVAEGVPVPPSFRVSCGGEDAEERLRWAVERLSGEHPDLRIALRPLFPNARLRDRFARHAAPTAIGDGEDAGEAVRGFLAGLRTSDLLGALGGSLARLSAVVFTMDPERLGSAASVDPGTGDPESLAVWVSRAAPWTVDRRTARVVRSGEGPLDANEASLVADLVDRAQLVLQHPVQIDWTRQGSRFVLTSVSPLHAVPAFSTAPYRILTLVAADEGTVAPLAIDALDRALSRDDEPSEEPRVRRIYARPYRRQDDTDRHRRHTSDSSVPRLLLRAARVAKDVALPLAAVRSFERGLSARLAAVDGQPLAAMDAPALIRELWERQRLAVEAFILLDRHRLATIAVLTALEMAGCAIPRESFPAIARPRNTRQRRRLNERLKRLAENIEEERGNLDGAEGLSSAVRHRFEQLRGELVDTRLLGIDICADAIGASDANLLDAIRRARRFDEDAFRRARRAEVRRIRQSAGEGALGRSRETLASSLVLLQSRVSRSKGVAVEGLAAVLLRVRRAAVEAGRRLVDAGVLDEPEDALYMDLAEIEEALRGEPGAYASRVRLRREDDARWARFEAPRRIEARRPHG
ncbi:MAG: hypothetical protein R3A78_13600 [Polyangiales bacterium]